MNADEIDELMTDQLFVYQNIKIYPRLHLHLHAGASVYS
jgi:hypothetical protein